MKKKICLMLVMPTNRQTAECRVRSARSNKIQNHWLKRSHVISLACARVSLFAFQLLYYAILLHCKISVKLPLEMSKNNLFIRELHLSFFFYNIFSYFFAKKKCFIRLNVIRDPRSMYSVSIHSQKYSGSPGCSTTADK